MSDESSKSKTRSRKAKDAGPIVVTKTPKADDSDTRSWRDQAGDFAKQATDTARDAATSAKVTTGEALHGLSKLIADTAGTVDSKLGPQYGDYARKAAEAVSGAAKSLDAKEIDDLAEDARNFVRKSPAVAIGAAAVVGFVLMRMMRGGSSDEAPAAEPSADVDADA